MIAVPKEVITEAKDFARETVDNALKGFFGIIDAQIKRRQSYAFAHEKALFHKRMVEKLPSLSDLALLDWRVKRHRKKMVKWEAKAFSRDPGLATACGLKCP